MRRSLDLFGSVRALAKIKPPCVRSTVDHPTHPGPCVGSYAEWERFLNECHKEGIAAIDHTGVPEFATPLGYALLKRWRWLQDALERDIPYHEAEAAFSAQAERESDANAEADRIRLAHMARAIGERDGKAKRAQQEREARSLMDYGEEILGSA